jgi:iron(III) transport system substrate-binding protein
MLRSPGRLFPVAAGPLIALGWLFATPAAAADALVVYCGRGEALVKKLLDGFTSRTGIELDVRYNDTPALATQFASERTESPADVLFFQESGYLGALADQQLLAALPLALVQPVDARFRDPDRRWVGISGRARVLVYDPQRVRPAELPRTLEELGDPRWKGRLGWAPGNASFQAHISALRHLWGEERTRAWLERVKELEPAAYPKNAPQVLAVSRGEIALGWVNHYYVHELRRNDPALRAANFSFPTPGDPGNVLMVAGAAISAHSPRQARARELLAYLVSEAAQREIAAEFEYPTRVGVAAHPDVTPLDRLNLARFDPAWLTDVGPTLALLRELGLQ